MSTCMLDEVYKTLPTKKATLPNSYYPVMTMLALKLMSWVV